jgi:hypothetical protein
MRRRVMQVGAGLMVLAVAVAAQAQVQSGGGLTRARSTLESFKTEILGVLPTIATIAGIILIALWKTGVIRARTLVQWGAGCALIGCVSGIVNLLMGSAASP